MIKKVTHYCLHPSEVVYLLRMNKEFKQFRPSELRLNDLSHTTDDIGYCYEALKKVSRSFSIVIQQLPEELKDPVCLFYLILRGLDTIEDDMNIISTEKQELLSSFGDRINNEIFTLDNVGDTQNYRDLMLHFDKVVRSYQNLDSNYKEIITSITQKMAEGMDKFATKDIISYDDWDEYCYYVAGLVGIGLSKLFIVSGLENNENLKNETLSNEMGLFLQKTNIIRDFAEDLEQGRVFWSEEIWRDKAKSLTELQQDKQSGLKALNEAITNALSHVPACLEFLKSIENPKIFRFCAIPQLMAIATLKELYNNVEALHKNVKIRKGRTAKYFIATHTFKDTKREFISILNTLSKKDDTARINVILSKALA